MTSNQLKKKGETMRSLKFRAWLKPRWEDDEDANKMYYDIQHSYDNLGNVKPCDPMTSFASWLDDEVAIVEQYTGLRDKNGKEIYEGDIVIVMGYGTYEVFWREWDSSFSLKPINTVKEENRILMLCGDWEGDYEVIGSIHESNMEELCA